jgi:hypothetical protein
MKHPALFGVSNVEEGESKKVKGKSEEATCLLTFAFYLFTFTFLAGSGSFSMLNNLKLSNLISVT